LITQVLIDADPIAYRAVFSKDGDTIGGICKKIEELFSRSIESVQKRYEGEIQTTAFITGSNNFRKEVSQDYKAQRPKEKPVMLTFARDYILDNYDSVLTEGEEADDAIAILATLHYPNAVIVSLDKDFRQVPCVLYNPNRDSWEEVDEWSGLLFFYEQLLVGDTADNIKGVNKVGPVKAKKLLDGATTELELWNRCLEAYEGDYDRAVMNGKLLWLRRQENQVWQPPEA